MSIFKRLRNNDVEKESELENLKAINTELKEIIIYQKQLINEFRNQLGIHQTTALYSKLATEYIDQVSETKGYGYSVKDVVENMEKLSLLNGKPVILSYNSFARLKLVLDILAAEDNERNSVMRTVDTQAA